MLRGQQTSVCVDNQKVEAEVTRELSRAIHSTWQSSDCLACAFCLNGTGPFLREVHLCSYLGSRTGKVGKGFVTELE